MHSQPEVDEGSANKNLMVVLFYNSTKSGVDIVDRMVKAYSCKRMTKRWPVILFYNMIDMRAINAFIVWLALNGENSSANIRKRQTFLIQLGKELVEIKVETGLSHFSPSAVRANSQKRKLTADNSPRPKKARCHICERGKDKNPAPPAAFAKTLFVFNILK